MYRNLRWPATLLKSSNDVFETHQCNAKLYLKTPTGMIYTTVKSFYWEHGTNPRLESRDRWGGTAEIELYSIL
jgi:hypothetical protein